MERGIECIVPKTKFPPDPYYVIAWQSERKGSLMQSPTEVTRSRAFWLATRQHCASGDSIFNHLRSLLPALILVFVSGIRGVQSLRYLLKGDTPQNPGFSHIMVSVCWECSLFKQYFADDELDHLLDCLEVR